VVRVARTDGTIHYVKGDKSRFYVYTSLCVFASCYACTIQSSHNSDYEVILQAQKLFGFPFSMIQTDNVLSSKIGYKEH